MRALLAKLQAVVERGGVGRGGERRGGREGVEWGLRSTCWVTFDPYPNIATTAATAPGAPREVDPGNCLALKHRPGCSPCCQGSWK